MSRKDTSKENSPVRKNSRYEKFHKLFKSVPREECPIDNFSCAFIGDILLQGHLYVSQNFFCFYSKIRGRGRLLEIPMSRVISITREKTALIIPNAIGFQTVGKKYVFGTFLTRDSTYKFVVSAWKKSQELIKQIQLSASETDMTFSAMDQTPETRLDNTDITQMFDTTQNNDLDNNNVLNGHLISQPDSEESDAGVCLACGSRDASDANDKGDISNDIVKKTNKKNVLISQHSTVVHEQPNKSLKARFFIGGGKLGIPYFFQCFDFEKLYEAFSQLSLKFQRIPRTNLILAVCIIMTLFLIVSAMALTYKILLLQARIEAKDIWTESSKTQWREKMYSSMYGLQSQSHFSVVKQMNEILKSNLHVLEELGEDLKKLKYCGTERSKHEKEKECS